MTYSSGTLIQATDYNNLAWGGTQGTYTASPNNIAYVMGVGSGLFGYGQDVTAINTVSAAGPVTATQWSGLLTTLNKAIGHQSGSGSQLTVSPTITAGNKITYFATIATAAGTINTNAALYSAQGSTLTGTAGSFNPNGVDGAAYSGFIDTNVTFSSANAARYFFNAGGQLNFTCPATNNNANTRSVNLTALINAMGGVSAFRNTTNGGRTGTGGTIGTNNTALGYRSLTTTAQNVVTSTEGAPYASDNAYIAVFCNTADTTNGSISASVVFRVYISTAADDAFSNAFNLTIAPKVDVVYPESTYLTTNSWGTPTITYDNA